MGCILGLFAFFLPRVAIVLLLLFSHWIQDPFHRLSSPFDGLLLPVVGLIFAPYTLLAYCLAANQTGGQVGGMWIVLIVIAVLLDLGVIGHGGRAKRRMARRQQ